MEEETDFAEGMAKARLKSDLPPPLKWTWKYLSVGKIIGNISKHLEPCLA